MIEITHYFPAAAALYPMRFLFTLLIFLTLSVLPETVVRGQMILTDVPSQHFRDITMRLINSGNFTDAGVALNDDWRGAVKISVGSGKTAYYLDAICYWTMTGEIYFQMGRYQEALTQFDTALQVYFENSDWLKKISAQGQPTQLPRPVFAWGTSLRKGGIGNFKTCRFAMSHKNFLPAKPGGGAQPGMVENRTDSQIHADYIVHSLSLLIRRRGEILGSLSKYDPATKRLADILAARPCLPNHFTGTWVDVLHGLVLSALRDDAAAETFLNRGLLMLNAYDHQLTAAALNELGNIAVRNGKAAQGRDFFVEASFDALAFNDPILLGETFRNAANAQRIADPTKRCPAIEPALAFLSKRKDVSPLVILSPLFDTAEYELDTNRIQQAAGLLEQAALRMSKTPLPDSFYGARLHYLSAAVDYRNAYINIGAKHSPKLLQQGSVHLESALHTAKRCSLRLFQLAKLETFFTGGLIKPQGPITERIADERFDELLRESTDNDWLLNPLDCWAVSVFVPPVVYERWFAIAEHRGNREKAFNIAERSKKAKYLAALPTGEDRLSAFRQLFETPEELLPKDFLVQRQILSLRFKEFRKLSDRIKKIKADLAAVRLVPLKPDDRQRQIELCGELESISEAQELLLRSMALTRSNVPQLFPPVIPLEQIRKDLPKGTAMLVFADCFEQLYGFLVGSDGSLAMWQVEQKVKEKPLYVQIADYLKALGNQNANQILPLKDLTNPNAKWKELGAALQTRLLGNEERNTDFTELVIVPSGLLWYLPFETLCVDTGSKDTGKKYTPLLTAGESPLTIRYAPTASLGVPKRSGKRINSETLVLLGKLKSSEPPETAINAFERFQKSGIKNLTALSGNSLSDGAEFFPSGISAGGVAAPVFASLIPNLVVLDEIPRLPNDPPLAWSPFQNDKAKKKNPVTAWLPLPYGGPQLVVMPAFHTAAESGLKERKKKEKEMFYETNGDDLFLSAMLLQSCGADTILISRWKTGGRSSFDLTEQFLKSYADLPAAAAWRQAVLTVGSSLLVLKEEPRVKEKETEETPFANHPFFWGGYMLIDRGELPQEEQKAEENL
ncbi:MAG: CHAT domain-containing protein [Planctomycetaceae bacterium]|jgi:tetratricopeptide (TPR) repeat protein|nr:CHAT domain-containing protein [Planctomycetaceae bacterium]